MHNPCSLGDKLSWVQAYLVQVISLARVWQVICWLPALFYWLQERQNTLLHIWLQAVHQFQLVLGDTVEHLHRCTML